MAIIEFLPQIINEVRAEVPPPLEIERKFLINTLPENLAELPKSRIQQGYLTTKGDEVRVRNEEGSYILARKTEGGLVREQQECELSAEQFGILWIATEGQRIVKDRYKIDHGEYVIELDIYKGNHEGLVVAEVESKTEEESQLFVPPFWFGREVTEEKGYKNRNLAKHGVPLNLENDSGMVVEQSLKDGVVELVGLIDEKKASADSPLFVHIAGRTSAGKTSAVTAEILKKFGSDSVVLSMDDYSKGNTYIRDMAEKGVSINWDHPDYMDFDLLAEHVHMLKSGESIEKPVFSFKTGETEGTERFEPRPVIIVEGLFALRPEVTELADVKAFVDISLHGSIVRRLLRDVTRTNMHPADILKYYLEYVEPMYQAHIAKTKENADMVLRNEYNPENEATRSGVYEVQSKFDVTIDDEMMRKAGAEILGTVRQKDYYLSPSDGDLESSGESVRIRKEDGRTVFSYKGPVHIDNVRVRPKIEFVIDDETENAFFDAYKGKVKVIDKVRKLYRLGESVVSLDLVSKDENGEITVLGNFLEVRCDQEKANEQMAAITTLLDLKNEQKVNLSYAQM